MACLAGFLKHPEPSALYDPSPLWAGVGVGFKQGGGEGGGGGGGGAPGAGGPPRAPAAGRGPSHGNQGGALPWQSGIRKMLTDLPKATLMEALSQLSFSPNNSTLGQAAKNLKRKDIVLNILILYFFYISFFSLL